MTRGITAKKIVRYGSIICLFVIIVGYGIWRSRDVLFGIRMTISGVTDGMTTTNPILTISGKARHANTMSVDALTIPLALDGTWTDTIALLDGYNVITVSATDKFGRTISDQYRVFYDAPAVPIQLVTPPATPAPATTPDTAPSGTTTTPPDTTTSTGTTGTDTSTPANPPSTASQPAAPAVQ